MTFDQWLDLVKQAGANVQGVDPAWLNTQWASNQSPVIVAQQLKSFASQLPAIVQPVQPSWVCRSCGATDWRWDHFQQHDNFAWVYIGATIVTICLLCIPVVNVIAIIACGFLWAYGLLRPKHKASQVPRCMRCGWMDINIR